MPKNLKPPDELIEILTMYCQANDIALAMIGSNDAGVCIMLMGNRDLTPDQASVIAADLLLQGIISRSFHEMNQEKSEEEKKPISKERLN